MRRSGTALRLLAAVALLAPAAARGERLVAEVRNTEDAPVKDAVVRALPVDAPVPEASPGTAVVDQVDKEFVPHVTAVRAGTKIEFPNRDQIRHHVYSFSEAKTFEIPLYKGRPARPVLFERPGEVVLGCNIHDWMKGYVYVTETPYFGVTDEEGAVVIELPPGRYRAEVWHPRLEGDPAETAAPVRVGPGRDAQLRFSIREERVWTPRRSPSLVDRGYR